MGKVCVAPGCKSGYKPKGNEGKKRRFHMFPRDESLRQLWTKAVPRKNWIPSRHSPESTDSNPSRSDRSGKTLCLKILKKDAVPSNFPNLPHYYSKKPPPKPNLKKIKAFEEANSFLTLEELQIKMDRTCLPSGVQEHYDEKDKELVFFKMNFSHGGPSIDFSLKINEEMTIHIR
ncbi:Putative LOC100212901 [Caligus rogercresseyi]|uniref:LOC100212901 n=1 Tax=Caligus rogercresseyi TaxID=217165 RepID=A0A7T8JTB0_CALRO|nr:Putative LOC100212901 [Caligus rogercresseyi]